MLRDLPSCSIHLVSVHAPEIVRKPSWKHVARGGQERWLEDTLRNHPWRVDDITAANVVLIAADFALLCMHAKLHMMGAQLGRVMKLAPELGRPHTAGRARAATFVESSCHAPFHRFNVTSMLSIKDLAERDDQVVAPPVLTGRRWLSATPTPGPPPFSPRDRTWAEAPLLFFAGHVPRLHISPLRYRLWRQLHAQPEVIAVSSTLNCTVRPMEICTSSARLHDGRSYKSFCHAACSATISGACSSSQESLQNLCARGGYAALDWNAERQAMATSTRALDHAEYGEQVITTDYH